MSDPKIRGRLVELSADDRYFVGIIVDGLHEFIDRFQTKLNGIGETIYETFSGMRSVNGAAAQLQVPL